MSGTVRDESGAVLPGVTVTATQTDTGVVRTVTTDETGSYVLPNLPTGKIKAQSEKCLESRFITLRSCAMLRDFLRTGL